MSYVPALDGLRAIAILAVLVFHAFPARLPGGFVGVDVFFVLSGYLITSTLLHDLRRETFTFREFFLRRVQRLLPNSVATVGVTLGLVLWLFPPSLVRQVAEHGAFTLLNASNVFVLRRLGGYWGDEAASAPLLHTWSLAVEEQFYLLFPLLLPRLVRRAPVRTMGLLTALSLAAYLAAQRGHADAAFYLLPTRAWQPLAGATLALHDDARKQTGAPPPRPSVAGVLGLGGIGLVVVACLFAREDTPFGLAGLVPALGTLGVLVGIGAEQPTLVRALSWRPLVGVGLVSYSLYLWHWPMIVLARAYFALLREPAPHAAVWGALASLPIALVAYRVVERPLRKRGPGRTRRLVGIGVGYAAALVACGLALRLVPVGAPPELFERPEFAGELYNAGARPGVLPKLGVRYADVVYPIPTSGEAYPWRHGGVIHRWGDGEPRVVVLGSSHALMYGRALDEICREARVSVAFLSVHGTSTFFPPVRWRPSVFANAADRAAFDEARRDALERFRPDVVVAVDRWDLDGEDAAFEERLERLRATVLPAARELVLVTQVPAVEVGESENLREYAAWFVARRGELPSLGTDPREPLRRATNDALRRFAATHPGVAVVDAARAFELPDGKVRWYEDHRSLYADDDHLSSDGAELVKPLLRAALLAALGTTSAGAPPR